MEMFNACGRELTEPGSRRVKRCVMGLSCGGPVWKSLCRDWAFLYGSLKTLFIRVQDQTCGRLRLLQR